MFNGYKCFDKGLTNRYGQQFEIGKLYHCHNEIKFGNDGNGFHVCQRLEDTLRYFDAMHGEVDIAKVICNGKYDSYEDDYNGYYDMYSFEYLLIEKVLTREEIITYGLNLSAMPIRRFISQFRLTEEEIALFRQKFSNNIDILNTIAYYQEDDKEAFNRQYCKIKKI